MKRSIVTQLQWDFAQYEGGLATTLPPPEDLSAFSALLSQLAPRQEQKPVRLASLSISSQLLRTRWRQIGSIYMTFDRVVFHDRKNHSFTDATIAMIRIMSELRRAGHIESGHGWGPGYYNGSFELSVDNKAFCEEAMLRGVTILRAFCPDIHPISLVPRIRQETYIWIPDSADSKRGQWKTYAETVAKKCGLIQ